MTATADLADETEYDFLFNLGFAAAWFLLMPVFVLGVGVALFSYAISTEVGECFAGHAKKSVDYSPARQTISRP